MKPEIYESDIFGRIRGHVARSARGLTLLEVMIALSLFAIGILAMASLAGTSMSGITIAQTKLFDSAAAAGQIETVLSRPYADPLLEEGDHAADSDSAERLPFAAGPSGTSFLWQVQEDFPATGAKLIRLTIRRSYKGQMRETTYAYVKARDFR